MVPLIVQVCLGVLYGLSGLTFIDHKAELIFHISFERPENINIKQEMHLFIYYICLHVIVKFKPNKENTNKFKEVLY